MARSLANLPVFALLATAAVLAREFPTEFNLHDALSDRLR
jgi:hypothetical protein